MEKLARQKELELQNFLENKVDNEEQPVHIKTNRHMRSVFTAAKNYMSFYSYVDIVNLQKQNYGTESMGQNCKSKE